MRIKNANTFKALRIVPDFGEYEALAIIYLFIITVEKGFRLYFEFKI